MTSAFLALQLFLGPDFAYVVVPFDQIFDAVKNGRADCGLIIHEGQLTYAKAGFTKIVDLGEWWKRETGLPLPLGGNVLRKDIRAPVRHDLLEIMRESIDYGLEHRDEAVQHSMPYARDMDDDARRQIHRHVRERLHARLRRKRTRGDSGISAAAPKTQGYSIAKSARICRVATSATSPSRLSCPAWLTSMT